MARLMPASRITCSPEPQMSGFLSATRPRRIASRSRTAMILSRHDFLTGGREHVEIEHGFVADHLGVMLDVGWHDQEPAGTQAAHFASHMKIHPALHDVH